MFMNKKRTNNKSEKKSILAIIKFLSIFIGIIAGYYILLAITDDNFFQSYLNFTATLSSLFINLLGENSKAINGIISSETVSMMLSFGCEGTEPIVILIAGIIAVPIPFIKKWKAGLISIIALYILNIFRIAALYFIQKTNPAVFDAYHTVYFPIGFILISLLLMAWSVQWSAKK